MELIRSGRLLSKKATDGGFDIVFEAVGAADDPMVKTVVGMN